MLNLFRDKELARQGPRMEQEPHASSPMEMLVPEQEKNPVSEDSFFDTQQDIKPDSSEKVLHKVLKCQKKLHMRLLERIQSGQDQYSEYADQCLKLAKQYEELEKQQQREIQTVRACQQETSQILNNELERHALNPAIEALVEVEREVVRLHRKVLDIKKESGICPTWREYAKELEITVSIVQDKLDCLDIQIINPQQGEVFDPDKHELCDRQKTQDVELTGKIHSVSTTGIWYRSKLLKRARVVVYYGENK